MNELAEELAVQLGLKNRKPYVSTKVSKMIVYMLLFEENKLHVFMLKNSLSPLSWSDGMG